MTDNKEELSSFFSIQWEQNTIVNLLFQNYNYIIESQLMIYFHSQESNIAACPIIKTTLIFSYYQCNSRHRWSQFYCPLHLDIIVCIVNISGSTHLHYSPHLNKVYGQFSARKKNTNHFTEERKGRRPRLESWSKGQDEEIRSGCYGNVSLDLIHYTGVYWKLEKNN